MQSSSSSVSKGFTGSYKDAISSGLPPPTKKPATTTTQQREQKQHNPYDATSRSVEFTRPFPSSLIEDDDSQLIESISTTYSCRDFSVVVSRFLTHITLRKGRLEREEKQGIRVKGYPHASRVSVPYRCHQRDRLRCPLRKSSLWPTFQSNYYSDCPIRTSS